MATAVHDVFEEHLGVIAALNDNYTRRDDIVSVENVIALKEEIARICLAREEDVKEAIKGKLFHILLDILSIKKPIEIIKYRCRAY